MRWLLQWEHLGVELRLRRLPPHPETPRHQLKPRFSHVALRWEHHRELRPVKTWRVRRPVVLELRELDTDRVSSDLSERVTCCLTLCQLVDEALPHSLVPTQTQMDELELLQLPLVERPLEKFECRLRQSESWCRRLVLRARPPHLQLRLRQCPRELLLQPLRPRQLREQLHQCLELQKPMHQAHQE